MEKVSKQLKEMFYFPSHRTTAFPLPVGKQKTRNCAFSLKSVAVSVAVSKCELFFIKPGGKANGQYCWESYYLNKC